MREREITLATPDGPGVSSRRPHPRGPCEDPMNLGRLFRVLVVGAGALAGGACATSSAAAGAGEPQRLPDGGVATPAPTPDPPMQMGGGGPSGW